jgi:hypothetical protein
MEIAGNAVITRNRRNRKTPEFTAKDAKDAKDVRSDASGPSTLPFALFAKGGIRSASLRSVQVGGSKEDSGISSKFPA